MTRRRIACILFQQVDEDRGAEQIVAHRGQAVVRVTGHGLRLRWFLIKPGDIALPVRFQNAKR